MTIARTDDGASGALEGVIPHEIGRFGEDFSHHCTNMGITARLSQTAVRSSCRSAGPSRGARRRTSERSEAKEVTVPIEDVPLSEGAPSGEVHGESLLEMFERLRKSVPQGAWDDMPDDGPRTASTTCTGIRRLMTSERSLR